MAELKNKERLDSSFEEIPELDYYTKLISLSQKIKSNEEKKEIKKCLSIRSVMNELKFSENKTLVKNALIIILALFENKPPDVFNSRGVDVSQISEKVRKKYIAQLKAELLSC